MTVIFSDPETLSFKMYLDITNRFGSFPENSRKFVKEEMIDRHSERDLCNCVKKPEKNSGLQRGSYMIYFIYH